MESTALALPLLPGKTDDWRRWSAELAGPRRSDYEASRRRLGVNRERAYLHQIPQGDVVIVYLEAENLQRMFEGISTSQEPFDVWFRQKVQELWGIDFAQGLPGPIPELVSDLL
jgi:hypothetical protein